MSRHFDVPICENLRPCSISHSFAKCVQFNFWLHSCLQKVWITLSGYILCMASSPHTNSKPDPVYEDLQLEANPAYGAAGMAMVVNEEENVEEDYLWN